MKAALEAPPQSATTAPPASAPPEGAVTRLRWAIAALVRWGLMALLVVAAPIALLAWSVLPRVTSPEALASEAVELGISEAAREALVDRLAVRVAEGDGDLAVSDVRGVLSRSISQTWFDTELASVAATLEGWLDESGLAPPDLAVDLVPVKGSLASDPAAVALTAGVSGCSRAECPDPTADEVIVSLPDTIDLLDRGSDADGDLFAARDRIQTLGNVLSAVPYGLAVALGLLALSARRGSRLVWLGSALVVISVPLLVVVASAPGVAATLIAGAVPAEFALETDGLSALFSWATRPAWVTGLVLASTGAAALGVSAVRGVTRHRNGSTHMDRGRAALYSG